MMSWWIKGREFWLAVSCQLSAVSLVSFYPDVSRLNVTNWNFSTLQLWIIIFQSSVVSRQSSVAISYQLSAFSLNLFYPDVSRPNVTNWNFSTLQLWIVFFQSSVVSRQSSVAISYQLSAFSLNLFYPDVSRLNVTNWNFSNYNCGLHQSSVLLMKEPYNLRLYKLGFQLTFDFDLSTRS